MELLREIIVPTENAYTLYLPDALIGKRVEVIAFELEEQRPETQTDPEKKASIQGIFEGVRVDLSHFKFDRNEANNYDE